MEEKENEEGNRKKRGPKGKFSAELFARVRQRVAEGELVMSAVKGEGMGLSQFYERVGENPEMAEALRQARMAKSLEVLEREAFTRALEGVPQPVYRAGKLVGEVRLYSDRILMFLLEKHAPERYGKRPGKGGKGQAKSPEKQRALRAEILRRIRAANEDIRVHATEFVANWKGPEAASAYAKATEDRSAFAEATEDRAGEDLETRRRGDAEKEIPEIPESGRAVGEDSETRRRGDLANEMPEIAETVVAGRADRRVEALEEEAFRRAVEGVEKPIFQGGKRVGEVRQRSDRLLIFLLMAQGGKYGRKAGGMEPQMAAQAEAEEREFRAQVQALEEKERELVRPFVEAFRESHPNKG